MGRLQGTGVHAPVLPDGTEQTAARFRAQSDLVAVEAARLRSEGKDSHALRVTESYLTLMAETSPERLVEAATRLQGDLTLWLRDLRARMGGGALHEARPDPGMDLIRTGTEYRRLTRAHLARRNALDTHDRMVGHVGISLCGLSVGDQVYLDDLHGWDAPSLNKMDVCLRCLAAAKKEDS